LFARLLLDVAVYGVRGAWCSKSSP
jgi:hypothetical protein